MKINHRMSIELVRTQVRRIALLDDSRAMDFRAIGFFNRVDAAGPQKFVGTVSHKVGGVVIWDKATFFLSESSKKRGDFVLTQKMDYAEYKLSGYCRQHELYISGEMEVFDKKIPCIFTRTSTGLEAWILNKEVKTGELYAWSDEILANAVRHCSITDLALANDEQKRFEKGE